MVFNCRVFWFLLEEILSGRLVTRVVSRKETVWCESRKTGLHDTENADIVD